MKNLTMPFLLGVWFSTLSVTAQNFQDFESYGGNRNNASADCWYMGSTLGTGLINGYSIRTSQLSGPPSEIRSPWLELNGPGVITFSHRAAQNTSSQPRVTVFLENKADNTRTQIFMLVHTNLNIITTSVNINVTGIYRIIWVLSGNGGGSSRLALDDIYYPGTDVSDRGNNPGNSGNCECVTFPPNTTLDNLVVQEDNSGTINVLTNDTDPENNLDPSSLTIEPSPLTNGTAVASGTGDVVYTPPVNFYGIDTVLYRVCDLTPKCSIDTLLVEVQPVNDPPQAVDDAYTINEDESPSFLVKTNDTDPDNTTNELQIVSATADQGVVEIVNHEIAITPPAEYAGTITIDYTIRDPQGLTSSATVTVEVLPLNDAPIAVDDSYQMDGLGLTMDVLVNDSDPDNLKSELTIVSAVTTSGVVTIVNNQLVLERTPEQTGTITIVYTIEDPDGLTATATVTIQLADLEPPSFAISEGFSPNGDGNNDTWFIRGVERYPANKVEIFDRWGIRVFSMENYDNVSRVWDGTVNQGGRSGKPLESGSYFYVFKTETDQTYKGYVVVVN